MAKLKSFVTSPFQWTMAKSFNYMRINVGKSSTHRRVQVMKFSFASPSRQNRKRKIEFARLSPFALYSLNTSMTFLHAAISTYSTVFLFVKYLCFVTVPIPYSYSKWLEVFRCGHVSLVFLFFPSERTASSFLALSQFGHLVYYVGIK